MQNFLSHTVSDKEMTAVGGASDSSTGVTTAWALSARELFQAAPRAWSPRVGLSLGQAVCQGLAHPALRVGRKGIEQTGS